MEKVLLKREDGVSIISLNRPESYNSLDIETLKQLLVQLKAVKENDDQVLIITGEGKAFCAGGDINMMKDMHELSTFHELMDVVSELTELLYLMPKIVISAVNFSAAGLGLSLALNADYIVANEETRFGMLFAGIGLIPDGGGHYFLEKRLGHHKAKQFIWSLKQVSGKEAEAFGFIDVLVEGDALEGAKQLAAQLQTSPILAFIESKLIYHEKNVAELRDVLQREKVSQLKMRATKDHIEGVDAFLSKRKPNFKGQ